MKTREGWRGAGRPVGSKSRSDHFVDTEFQQLRHQVRALENALALLDMLAPTDLEAPDVEAELDHVLRSFAGVGGRRGLDS